MRSRSAAVSLAAGVATACLWLVLGTQSTLPDYSRQQEGWSGDFRSYYVPNATYAGERLAAGELPLWNPHQALGDPLLATLQVGALYPPNWLHAALPADMVFVVLAFAHLCLAGFAAGILAWVLGATAAGSAVAALLYAGSLQMMGSIYSPPLIYSAAWAPLLLVAVDRLASRVTPRRVVLLAVSVAMMLLSGWPYTLAMTSLGAALYGGVLLAARVIRERRVPTAAVAALLAGVLAGALLAAPQLLPTRELLVRSCRALGTVVEGQAVAPPLPHDPTHFWRTFVKHGFNAAIPGVAALALAALALLLPGPGRARVSALLGVGVVGLLASFPNDAPVYGWLRELPLLGDFRFPFRYRFLTSLTLSVAAGVGAAHLVRALARWPGAARVAGVGVLLICVFTAVIPAMRSVLPFARKIPAAVSLSEELRASGVEMRPGARDRVYWAGRSNKRGGETDLDVLYDNEPLSLARTAEMITFFETGRPRTLLSMPSELDGKRRRGDSMSAPFSGQLGIPSDGERRAILDLLSARWIVTPDPKPWLAARYRRASPPDAVLAVFENPDALPRAYRVPGAFPTPPHLPAALRTLSGTDFDPRRLVLLDDPPQTLLTAARAGVVDPAATVKIERFEEQHVTLRTRGDREGVVVLTDAFFPGWSATLDDREVPILRANTAFRGVIVPPGEHVVEMRYRSAPLRWGVLVAFVTAALLAAAVRFWSPRSV